MSVGGRAVSSSTNDRPSIVIAEDSSLMLTRLQLLLAPQCEVLAAVADGNALVEAVRTYRPDVIVTDIDMPGMTGFDAARVILAEQPDARIVFVTTIHDPEIIRAALAIGALGFVGKRDAGYELVKAVRSTMDGKKYISQSGWNAFGKNFGARQN